MQCKYEMLSKSATKECEDFERKIIHLEKESQESLKSKSREIEKMYKDRYENQVSIRENEIKMLHEKMTTLTDDLLKSQTDKRKLENQLSKLEFECKLDNLFV
jgi:hypothetical protein